MSKVIHLHGPENEVDNFRVEESLATRSFLKSISPRCISSRRSKAQKMVDGTPQQCITKYAKATSKQEGHMDHHIRGSYHDVNLNRALTHWLSCANLPYNVLDGGVFMNWCCTNNPWYRVACRPYIQRNFLDTGYAAAKNAFCMF